MEKVSIILTIYNNSNYLENCIKSILNQTHSPEEIILIDDGSKDQKTKEIYIKLKINKKTNFRYYKIKNSGPSCARNFGLKKIKYDYFCFFDPDDLMTSHFISDKISQFKKLKDKNFFGVYSQAKFTDIETYKFKIGVSDKKNIDGMGHEYGISGSLPCYLFRMNSSLKSIKFDEKIKINEDFDFIIRALNKNLKIYGINKINTLVNYEAESLTRSKKNYYLVYHNQVSFLKKAEERNWFSKDELKIRKRYAESKISIILFKKLDLINFFRHLYRYLKI